MNNKLYQIWQKLTEHADEAYEVYLEKFDWYSDTDEAIAQQLKENLREDFKKIPAALLNNIK
jgi:hypothetical protein